jgi:hypothetical protein
MVECYQQENSPDSSTRALWQSYQQLSSSKAVRTGEGKDEFLPYEESVSYFDEFFNMHTFYDIDAFSFTFPSKEVVLRILIAHKGASPSVGF